MLNSETFREFDSDPNLFVSRSVEVDVAVVEERTGTDVVISSSFFSLVEKWKHFMVPNTETVSLQYHHHDSEYMYIDRETSFQNYTEYQTNSLCL